MTEEQANAIYNLLVAHAGANDEDRDSFVYHMADGCTEWRFQGWLGFGGKLYVERGRLRVGAYPEDLVGRPGRQGIIDFTNAKLAELAERETTR